MRKRRTVAAKRKITLSRTAFTVPASGRASLKVRLSRKAYATLRRNRRIRTKVTVTLRDGIGRTSTATTSLTLTTPR
ncbi:MAG: hypothetical protein ACEQSX_08150 [Baekduiaceae bacterium]